MTANLLTYLSDLTLEFGPRKLVTSFTVSANTSPLPVSHLSLGTE